MAKGKEPLHTVEETLQADRKAREAEHEALVAKYREAYTWLFEGLYTELAKDGGELRGFSFRLREADTLLVIRMMVKGAQVVAFIADRTTTDCVVKACRKWHEGTLNLSLDRFA